MQKFLGRALVLTKLSLLLKAEVQSRIHHGVWLEYGPGWEEPKMERSK